MKDISLALNNIMQAEQCSSIYAFFLLTEKTKDGDRDGICKLQSKSSEKTGGGLRNKGYF